MVMAIMKYMACGLSPEKLYQQKLKSSKPISEFCSNFYEKHNFELIRDFINRNYLVLKVEQTHISYRAIIL